MNNYLIIALQLAGLGQIVLVLASIAIPRCLQWDEGLSGLRPLLRQMFWTYAVYVTGLHLFAGVVTLFTANELINGSFISTAVCLLMALWWGTRVVIQFFFFDRSDVPDTLFNKIAEVGLVSLFIYLTVVYSWAITVNLA